MAAPLPLLIPHVAAAGVALLSGAAAMVVRKGGARHRAIGTIFCIAMLAMSATAIVIAIILSEAINLMAGTEMIYLVATSWQTARTPDGKLGRLDYVAPPAALAIAAAIAYFGLHATDPGDAVPCYIFAGVAALAGAGDIVRLVRGGSRGKHRLIRHLWRMCFALLVTVISFFVARSFLFPKFIRAADLQYAPVLAVLAAMIFWTLRLSLARHRTHHQPAGWASPTSR